jgi:hypothetical protein
MGEDWREEHEFDHMPELPNGLIPPPFEWLEEDPTEVEPYLNHMNILNKEPVQPIHGRVEQLDRRLNTSTLS